MLTGKGDIAQQLYKMTNIEKSSVSYMMDPEEQFRVMKDMRKNGHKMVAIYHSHPHSQAYPSLKDISLAFYSDQIYLIVGLTDKNLPEVRAFEILEGKVREVQIEARVDASLGDELK